MNPHEYSLMFSLEDRHWWYRGLRALLAQFWRKYMRIEHPRALDAGCGTGAVLDWLKNKTQREPVGLDLSPLALRFSRQRGRTHTMLGSVEALPFAAETFDTAVSFDVLYHRNVKQKDRALREIHRVLKPSGLLFMNLPAYQWLYSSHDAAVQTDKRFTRPEVLQLLRASAFVPLECAYWNTLLFPPIALVRLWRKTAQPDQSDLATSGGLSDQLFSSALAIERKLIRVAPMPFGLSIFSVAKKL